MNSIVLAYSTLALAENTSYNADFPQVLPETATGSQLTLSALKLYSIPVTEVATGKTLRGRSYEHILYRDKEHTVVISADELIASAKRDFMTSWWNALHKYICLNTTTGKYIPVVAGGGSLPVEFINENKYLQEITLKLVENG